MNDFLNEKAEALIAEIIAAFDGVLREGGLTLHEAAGIADFECTDGERAANRAKDTDVRWQDVQGEWIAEIGLGDLSLSFFDSKGFRYYIPAYLVWMLKSWMQGGVANNTEDAIVFCFTPSHTKYFSQRTWQLLAVLNENQLKAIKHFLEFLAEQDVEGEYGGFVNVAQRSLNAFRCQSL